MPVSITAAAMKFENGLRRPPNQSVTRVLHLFSDAAAMDRSALSFAGASIIEVRASSGPLNPFPDSCCSAELRLSTTYQRAKAHTHQKNGWFQAVSRTGFILK